MITFSYLFALFALFAFIISTVIILIECNYKKKSFISFQDTNAIRDKVYLDKLYKLSQEYIDIKDANNKYTKDIITHKRTDPLMVSDQNEIERIANNNRDIDEKIYQLKKDKLSEDIKQNEKNYLEANNKYKKDLITHKRTDPLMVSEKDEIGVLYMRKINLTSKDYEL
jgi:hypothetical protein